MEFLGFVVDTVTLQLIFPNREAEEDPTVSSTPPSPAECLSERCGKVCGQSFCINESNMASPIALQSTAVFDQTESLGQTEQATMKFNTNLNLTKEAESDLRWWISLDWKVPIQSPIVP